ncbi:MAG: hypothetical protein AAGF01_22045 [Cyanobacteria bacterium P01_G01_bin.38]
MTTVAVLFVFTGIALTQPSIGQTVTDPISAETLQSQTNVPVLLPPNFTSVEEDPLYSEVIYVGPDGYYVAYSFIEDCGDAGYCGYARIQGHEIGSTTSHFKPDTLQALVEERMEVLDEATRISSDTIQDIRLVNDTPGIVLPWFGYTHPGNTEVLIEQDGYRYIFSIRAAQNQEVIDLANSIIENQPNLED